MREIRPFHETYQNVLFFTPSRTSRREEEEEGIGEFYEESSVASIVAAEEKEEEVTGLHAAGIAECGMSGTTG